MGAYPPYRTIRQTTSLAEQYHKWKSESAALLTLHWPSYQLYHVETRITPILFHHCLFTCFLFPFYRSVPEKCTENPFLSDYNFHHCMWLSSLCLEKNAGHTNIHIAYTNIAAFFNIVGYFTQFGHHNNANVPSDSKSENSTIQIQAIRDCGEQKKKCMTRFIEYQLTIVAIAVSPSQMLEYCIQIHGNMIH